MRASAKPCRYSTPLSDRPERRRPAKTKQVFHKFKWKLWKAKENTSVLFPIAGKSGGKRAARRSICPDSHGNRSLSPPLSAPPESAVRQGENSTDCICFAGFSANQIAISIFYSHDRKSIFPNQKDKRYNKIVVIFRLTFRSRIEFCRNPYRFS